MQKYRYVAMNLQRQKIKGVFLANDEQDLEKQLAKQSLFLISAKPYDSGVSSFFTWGTGKVSNGELTAFCRQFSIMLNTHIPILDCLDILKNQPYTSFFRSVISVIYEEVKGGTLLSDALEKKKKVFPDFFRSMVRVGELSGKLDEVFRSLSDYYEKDAELRRKLKAALAYPIMLAVMTLGIVVLMLAVVIPTFRETLAKLEVEPTGLTAAVYARPYGVSMANISLDTFGPTEERAAAPVGEVIMPMRVGIFGIGFFFERSKSPSAVSFLLSCSYAMYSAPTPSGSIPSIYIWY